MTLAIAARRLLVLGAASTALCIGCGGSSSETPPPQQPDSWQMVMRKPEATPASSGEAKRSPWGWGRYNKAESTWGTKPRPSSTPAPSPAPETGASDDL